MDIILISNKGLIDKDIELRNYRYIEEGIREWDKVGVSYIEFKNFMEGYLYKRWYQFWREVRWN